MAALTVAACDESLRAALADVARLESALVQANAKVQFYRRQLRAAALKELVDEHGGSVDDFNDSQGDPVDPGRAAPPPPPASTGLPLAPAKGSGSAADVGLHGGAAGAPVHRGKQSRDKRPPNVCVACWNESRGKSRGAAHLWRPPCQKQRSLSQGGRPAKRARSEGEVEEAPLGMSEAVAGSTLRSDDSVDNS